MLDRKIHTSEDKMQKFHLYFIRHGQTKYNAEHRIQGQCDRAADHRITDQPLTEIGIQEAHNAAKALIEKGISIDLVASSPLLRAQQAGEIIASYFDVKVHLEPGLKEMFFEADNEGLQLADFRKKIFNPPIRAINYITKDEILINSGEELRELHKRIEPEYDLICHPGGETKLEVKIRMQKTIQIIVANATHSKSTHADSRQTPKLRVLIPTHNAALRFFLSDIDKEQARLKVKNGEILQLKCDHNAENWEFIQRF